MPQKQTVALKQPTVETEPQSEPKQEPKQEAKKTTDKEGLDQALSKGSSVVDRRMEDHLEFTGTTRLYATPHIDALPGPLEPHGLWNLSLEMDSETGLWNWSLELCWSTFAKFAEAPGLETCRYHFQ